MEDTFANSQKDENITDDLLVKEESELLGEDHLGFPNSTSNELTKRIIPLHSLHRTSDSCTKNSVFPSSFVLLDEQIPERLVTINEKYIQQCLELIHVSASNPAQSVISVKVSLVKTSILSDYFSLAKTRVGESCDVDRLLPESPFTSESGSVVISPVGKWIIGSILGSKSLMNILKSPLLHQFAALENTLNSRKLDSNDATGSTYYHSKESPYQTSKFSSQFRESTSANHEDGSDSGSERIVSSSPQSFLGSATLYRGMLQCNWKDGIPHFVFSSDDHQEIYEANLWKVNDAGDKGSDYIYLFHSGKTGKKNENYSEESFLTGKMTVSTSFTLCPNNSKIMETEFVLYGGIGMSEVEINSLSDNVPKKKLLSRKVVDVFRKNHLSKRRSVSNFSGPTSEKDCCPSEPPLDTSKNLDNVKRFHLLEDNLPTNFQLAAIVVKDHLREKPYDNNLGGWGLKFLNKVESKPTSHLLENSVTSECYARNSGDCSTSTNIIIPASLHGGPRTRIGGPGPSTLTERWRSGGGCDCGGWDLGCHLTVLKVQMNDEERLPRADMHGECKSVDICVQGSEHGPPNLRMVNIRDDLYFIHFQPNLSSLQSFSIAVAIIHSRSPTLKPKDWPS